MLQNWLIELVSSPPVTPIAPASSPAALTFYMAHKQLKFIG